MQNLVWARLVGISLSAPSALAAQVGPPEKERVVCDLNDPKNKCPGASCFCTEDTFEITFDGGTNSVYQFDRFVAGTPIPTQVICDAKSTKPNPAPPPDVLGLVQGWSFGVEHDDAFLTLTGVTAVGTDARTIGQFAVTDMVDIQTCANDPDPKCRNPEPATGYIAAVIIDIGQPVALVPGRSSLVKADYTLEADPGRNGTLIQFVDYLKKINSPPVDLNITVDGRSRRVTKVIDGWVKDGGGEHFGTPEDLATPGSCTDGADNDLDGKVDAADEGCQPECRDYAFYFGPAASGITFSVGDEASYAVTMQNKDSALGFQLGVKTAKAGGGTSWAFSGELGADVNRLIELIITDDKGDSQTPMVPNTAVSSRDYTVESITRGAAIAGFSNDDFFEFDLAPAFFGPGFTVGYVADLTPAAGAGNKIPPTGTGISCTVNEILKVNLGGGPARFRRGDANGDSKINVTDAVLIIQNIVGNIPKKFACDDILDTDDDGSLTFADVLPVLAYVFQRGPDLPAPFQTCGGDPTVDARPCRQSRCE